MCLMFLTVPLAMVNIFLVLGQVVRQAETFVTILASVGLKFLMH